MGNYRQIQRPFVLCSIFLTSARLDATRHRWVAELADFNFHILYKLGSLGNDADGLSPMPLDVDHFPWQCTKSIKLEEVKAVCLLSKRYRICHLVGFTLCQTFQSCHQTLKLNAVQASDAKYLAQNNKNKLLVQYLVICSGPPGLN